MLVQLIYTNTLGGDRQLTPIVSDFSEVPYLTHMFLEVISLTGTCRLLRHQCRVHLGIQISAGQQLVMDGAMEGRLHIGIHPLRRVFVKWYRV